MTKEEMLAKHGLKEKEVLYLPIKQVFYDEILAGTKKQEFREVKPTTIKKLLQLDENGYEVVDENENAIPVEYKALYLAVGYNKERDTALVEVESAYCEIFVDENDKPIEYEHNGDIWVAEQVVYNLGKVLEVDRVKK